MRTWLQAVLDRLFPPPPTPAPAPAPSIDELENRALTAAVEAATTRMLRIGCNALSVEAESGVWMMAGMPSSRFHAATVPRYPLLCKLVAVAAALDSGDQQRIAAATGQMLAHIAENLSRMPRSGAERMEH